MFTGGAVAFPVVILSIGVLALAAPAGCAWFAVSFDLFVPDISY